MANDKEVNIKFTVDTAGTAKTLNDINQAIKDLKEQAGGLDITSSEFKKVNDKVNELNKTVSTAGQTSLSSFGKFKAGIMEAGGAVGGFGQSFAAMGKVLLTNPIGLVITAVASLITYLQKFEPITNAISAVVNGLTAGFEALVANIGGVISSIHKLLTLDFSGAAEDIKGVGNAIKDQASAAYQLVEAQDALDEAETASIVTRAKAESQEANLIIQAKNKILTDKEKIALIEKARKIGLEQYEAEKKLADQRLAAAELELKSVSKSSNKYDELNKKVQEATASQIKLLGERNNINEKYDNKVDAIQQAATDKEKAELDKRNAAWSKHLEDINKRNEDAKNQILSIQKSITESQNKRYLETIKDAEFKEQEILRLAYEGQQKELDLQIKALKGKKNLTQLEINELAELNKLKTEQQKSFQESKSSIVNKYDELDLKKAKDIQDQKQKFEDDAWVKSQDRLTQKMAAIDKETEAKLDQANKIGASQESINQIIKQSDDARKIAINEEAKLISDVKDKEVADAKKAEDEKLAAKKKSIDEGFAIAKQSADALNALNDLVTVLENNRVKKGLKSDEQAKKDQFKRTKALAVVSAAINVAQGITSALSTQNYPGAILTGITGAIQIAAILAKKYDGGSTSPGSVPSSPDSGGSGGGSAPSIQAAQMVTLGQPTLTRSIGQKDNKVVVTDKDIKSVGNRVNVIEDRSKISLSE